MSTCSIEKVKSVGSSLRRLFLNGSHLNDDAVADLFRLLPYLFKLSLAHCHYVSAETLNAVARLSKLAIVDLGGIIDDSTLEIFAQSRVHSLDLSSCRVTEKGLLKLIQARGLPNLRYVFLHKVSIADPFLFLLPQLAQLSSSYRKQQLYRRYPEFISSHYSATRTQINR